ncbi:serine--tRNA ligase, partial [Phytoactinopolyspora endophytica]|uniref:serine--tRNA ligase n=1 Tax=Phytoactinopolyspora endophytica TaxID=1642495 RepID=UPI001F0CF13A
FLTGVGAQLELGILNLAMSTATEAGFTPVITPTLVRPEIMAGTGFLGAHADEIYRLERDDLYLVGTSEVALAGYHADEIVDLSDGPLRYAGWSACYRREAGSHGKDTRGIIRVHQFHKVEMFCYCREEDAAEEHERLLGWEERMLAAMELPYRVIDVAAGDLGSSAARKFDCEAWLPSQSRWMEVTSTSNCTTFQARRLNIRERTDNRTRSVATLNGTLGTTRWLVAVLENHQLPDGSVSVPEALRPYVGGREILEPGPGR